MSSAKGVPGYRMFVRDLRKPDAVESCELLPTDERQNCSTSSVSCSRKESDYCTARNDQLPPKRPGPWKSVNRNDRMDCTIRSNYTMNKAPTPKSSQKKATVRIKSEKDTDLDGRNVNTTFNFKSTVTTRTKEPSKRRPRGGTIFERREDNDNISLITIDTQKLLAMLEESENEVEGLSIGASAKISSTRSSSESVFEPLRSTSRKISFLRVVQKKPSPVGILPLDRLQKRWNKPVIAQPDDKNLISNVHCQPTYETQLPPSGAEQQNWWTKAEAHKWKERARLKKSVQSEGYSAGQNTSNLPPIAHLGQLSTRSRPLVCDDGDCRAEPSEGRQATGNKAELPVYPSREDSGATQLRPPRPADSAASTRSGRSRRVISKSRSRHSARLSRPKSNESRVRFKNHDASTGRTSEDEARRNRVPQSYRSTVFAQEMVKTNQIAASRSSGPSTVHKVFGDPSVIKLTDVPPGRNLRTGPLQASDLMALEEDVNDDQQQEDSKRLARFMSEDLKEQVFTDISIQCKNREFKIHKEYLLAFTTYDIPVVPGETMRDIPALNLTDLDSSDVATVLHFLYYGELKLNVYNILGVRSAVQALGVTDLPPVIQEFHDKLFTPPNMINLIEFAQAKKLQDLFTYSWKLFVAMFYEHINGSHFLNWDVRWVLNLLSHENLPIKTELEVFEVGRLWLNHRPEERSDDVKAVLSAVRWTYMSPEEMVECEREDPHLMSRFEAHELVSDANWYKVMMRNGVPWSDFNIPPPRGSDSGGPPQSRRLSPPSTVSNIRFNNRLENESFSPLSQSTRSDRNLPQAKSVSKVRSEVSARSKQSKVGFVEDHADVPGAGSESSFNSLDIDMSNLSLTSLEG